MSSVYYLNLMYVKLRISDTLHKKPCRIGPGLCGTPENRGETNFGESPLHALG